MTEREGESDDPRSDTEYAAARPRPGDSGVTYSDGERSARKTVQVLPAPGDG